jgi:hypothetical protein
MTLGASGIGYIAAAFLFGVVTATAQGFQIGSAEWFCAACGVPLFGLLIWGHRQDLPTLDEHPKMDVLVVYSRHDCCRATKIKLDHYRMLTRRAEREH